MKLYVSIVIRRRTHSLIKCEECDYHSSVKDIGMCNFFLIILTITYLCRFNLILNKYTFTIFIEKLKV